MTRDKSLKDLVASAVGEWLHVGRPVFTRNGVTVPTAPPSAYNAVGDLVR